MDKFELQDFNKRIKLNTDLKNISEQICIYYNLGDFVSNELITIVYKDKILIKDGIMKSPSIMKLIFDNNILIDIEYIEI